MINNFLLCPCVTCVELINIYNAAICSRMRAHWLLTQAIPGACVCEPTHCCYPMHVLFLSLSVWLYIYIHICIFIYKYTCIHIYTYICIYIHARHPMHALYIYTHKCISIKYIYVCIYIHTHIHICIYLAWGPQWTVFWSCCLHV